MSGVFFTRLSELVIYCMLDLMLTPAISHTVSLQVFTFVGNADKNCSKLIVIQIAQ